ncbi:MAG: SUMF1/EgtB/PvdO family nonheme iron enzyme [Chloroflexi bacterium]|nr:SUMF1/EgtB/PvdO family nonheme iron enzyme [Chloroflexota bacterium]MCY3583332.1 SUMF1/EgtB/PvdO family nonheme iron enzyme [Chloroflexota bacterium]MCY3716327.1 SUMF1/EgtB/PvdO family nonheme iron enzyme [Chloroflexota bacterium]MDE2651346.1 SUMF1/EgtB/PvdO family nonheme iron enzyme [Chloroflexota bacterium]MXV93275.1 SUMF1/EgtB/PvdO family nonheme iron enzyme [Chloroflexota bacterium]
MKIFVSYAREDKPFCIRIIETLHAHEVWYDQRLYAGQDWWKEIRRRLAWCEVFVFLLSPESVASRNCLRELAIARQLKRAIIPVLIDSATVLPEAMRAWHYVDLSQDLTAQNVSRLLSAVLMAERAQHAATSSSSAPKSPASQPDATKPAALISAAVQAMEEENYQSAVRLLRQANASGYQSRFLRVDELLRSAQAALSERQPQREAQREYQHIAALFNFESTRGIACEALAEFQKEFGDYDPQNLRRHCAAEMQNQTPAPLPQPVPAPSQPIASSPIKAAAVTMPSEPPAPPPARESVAASFSVNDFLPMLQWCDIPHGNVTISSIVGADEEFGEITEQVDNFVMSKYPVTNAQFAIFVHAEDGYRNPRWWAFSEYAQRWFAANRRAAEPRFAGETLPRENVNWYEAKAFANWLGAQLRMKVNLPTVAQWQRAAKGDDDRYFPWGDDYDEDRCNTVETGLKQTTSVDRYHKGVSPYGVYDMSGNTWEWTLNTAAAAEDGRDLRRAVAGGSYVSSCDRAQTSVRYYLEPRVRYSSIGMRLVATT